jgi:hypothetical protein
MHNLSKLFGAWIARHDAAKAARSTSAMQADWFNRFQGARK